MSEEKKADLEGAFAEFVHEVWLAIKQGQREGAYKSEIIHEDKRYGLVIRFDALEDPVTMDGLMREAGMDQTDDL